MKRDIFYKWIATGGLLLVGIGIGSGLQTANTAHGEVRTGPPPTSFKSGSQLSIPILKEIAATLHTMDARLAKLEAAAQKMQTQKR